MFKSILLSRAYASVALLFFMLAPFAHAAPPYAKLTLAGPGAVVSYPLLHMVRLPPRQILPHLLGDLNHAFTTNPSCDEPYTLFERVDRCLDETGATMLCISHHPHELVELTDSCLLLENGYVQRFDIDPAEGAQGRSETADLLYRRLLQHEALVAVG